MACADITQKEGPLQIIQIESSTDANGEIIHELKLNEENLSRILEQDGVKDNMVMIVSIAGPLRKGKSFIVGFILKYLKAKMSDDWLSENDRIEGFEWRNGTDGVTHGIQIWSKPFIVENKPEGKVAILLMDTQGIFDSKSTKQDCANIFTLSGLISSVQIYNLMHQIQEDDLENLEYFTEFGKLIQEKSAIKDASKSRLIFLIRDWGCPHEFPYGLEGGEDYVRKQLQEEDNQHQQLKIIRKNLNGGFLETGGFLLPYPGKVVATNHRFAGLVKDIDEDFLEYVKILVPYVIPENKLTPKRMNGRDLKGKEMLVYIKTYVELLRDGDYETLETAVEATAAAYRKSAFKKAYKLYEDEMEQRLERWDFVSLDDLKEHHTLTKEKSLSEFTNYPRIKVAEHEQLSLNELKEKIEEKYHSYEKRAHDKAAEDRKSAVQQAYRLYKDEMKESFEMCNFESLDDLREHHTLTMEQSLSKFADSLRMKVAELDTLSLNELKGKIEEKYHMYEKRALDEAAENRKSAVQQAYKLYNDEMEELFEMWDFESLDDLREHHILTMEQSLSNFTGSPRIKVVEQDKLSLKELKKKIEEKYHSYEQRALTKAGVDRKSAFQRACNQYKEKMKKLFRNRNVVWSEDLKVHHRRTEENSLNGFINSSRIKIPEYEESDLLDLQMKINEIYLSYKKRTTDNRIIDIASKAVIPGGLTITTAALIVGSPVLALTGGVVSLGLSAYFKFLKMKDK